MTTTATQTFNTVFLRAFAAGKAEPQFETDSRGRMVRIFTKDAPLTREIARPLYVGTRAVEIEDILETIGKTGMDYAVKAGWLVEDKQSKGRFLITEKAAKHYNLPRPVIGGTPCNWLA